MWGGGASWDESANHRCFKRCSPPFEASTTTLHLKQASAEQLSWRSPTVGEVTTTSASCGKVYKYTSDLQYNISWRSLLRKDTTSIFRPSISTLSPKCEDPISSVTKAIQHIKNADCLPIVFLGHRSNWLSEFEQFITCSVPARPRVSEVCCKNHWFGFHTICFSRSYCMQFVLCNQCSDYLIWAEMR